jgi:hypothetical protein
MTPETPKTPRKPRKTNKTEQAKVRSAVSKVIMNAESEVKKAIGRPSTYDPVISHKICEQLSEGIPLREICRQEGYPSYRAIYRWMVQDEDLSSHIARAREVGYDNMAEECLDIADNSSNDWMDREIKNSKGQTDVERVVDTEHIQRSKLRIETRLKLLAKWRPEKYGDKTIIAGDPNGAPIKTEETSSGRLFELIRNMEMGKRVTE